MKLDKRVASGGHLLEKLQKRLHCDLTSQRYAIKLLIIDSLRKRPVPQTNASFEERDAVSFPVMLSKASIAALNIPELLESILSHLPMENLFTGSLRRHPRHKERCSCYQQRTNRRNGSLSGTPPIIAFTPSSPRPTTTTALFHGQRSYSRNPGSSHA